MLKKLLFVLVCLLSISNAIAQRQVDLSCEAVLKPDTVFTYQTTYCSMIAKNNGPDTLYADDTISYVFIMPGNGFGDIYFPSTGTYFKKINKMMLPGDTLFIDIIIPSVTVKKTDYNEFSGSVFIYKRKDKMKKIEEDFSLLSNNDNTKYIWYMGDNIGILIEPDTEIKVYPTIVEENINIESLQPISNICLIDINGRIVKNFSGKNTQQSILCVGDIPSGIYLVKTQINNQISLKKIIKL